MSVDIARLARTAGADPLEPLLQGARRAHVLRGGSAEVRETLTAIAGALGTAPEPIDGGAGPPDIAAGHGPSAPPRTRGPSPSLCWLALVTGRRDEVDFCVQLAGVAADAVAPRLPRGARAGALVTLGEGSPAVAHLIDALGGGRQRLSLLLVRAGADAEAARALLLVGAHGAAVARARAAILAGGGQGEALAVTTGESPPQLRSARSGEEAPPPWAVRWAAETPSVPAVVTGRVDASLPPPAPRRHGPAVAGLPRGVATAATALIVATLVLTGFLVAGHARDAAAPRPADTVVALEPRPTAAPAPMFPPPAIVDHRFLPTPRARHDAAVAVDPSSGSLVLFGGATEGSVLLGDTWALTNQRWRLLSPQNAPAPRQGAAMAYDPQTRSLILFGGLSASGAVDETWTFRDGIWTPLRTTHAPPACPSAMTTDPASRSPLLVDVCSGATAGSPGAMLVYVWRDGDWTQQPQDSPAPMASMPLIVPDPTPGGSGVLAFSTQAVPPHYPAVWRWTGRHWDVVAAAQVTGLTVLFADPQARAAADTADGVVLLVLRAGDWLWDGQTWSPVPNPAAGPAMALAVVTGLDGAPLAIGGASPQNDTTTVFAWRAARGWLTLASTIRGSAP